MKNDKKITSEIRQLNSEKEDLKKIINEANSSNDLQKLEDEIKELQAGLNKSVDNLNKKIELNSSNIEKNQTDLTELNNKFPQIVADLSNFSDKVIACENNLADLQTNLQNNEKNLQNLQTELNKTNDNFDSLQVDFQNSSKEITSELTSVKGRLTTAENNISDLDSRLGKIEKDFIILKPKVEDNEKNILSLSNRVNSTEQTLSSLNNVVQNALNDIENFKISADTIPTLQASLENLINEKIPELENKINSSGGGSSSPEWELLYDKDDPNPAINLGQTSGIFTDQTRIETMPDLKDFRFLKVKFCANYEKNKVFYCDMSGCENNCHHSIIFCSTDNLGIFYTNFQTYLNSNNKLCFETGRLYRIYFYSNYIRYTMFEKNEFLYFYRIEGLR